MVETQMMPPMTHMAMAMRWTEATENAPSELVIVEPISSKNSPK